MLGVRIRIQIGYGSLMLGVSGYDLFDEKNHCSLDNFEPKMVNFSVAIKVPSHFSSEHSKYFHIHVISNLLFPVQYVFVYCSKADSELRY
jgi:hypothetical protein